LALFSQDLDTRVDLGIVRVKILGWVDQRREVVIDLVQTFGINDLLAD